MFLACQPWVDKIVGALHISRLDTIVEIGPGRGALTKKILHDLQSNELARDGRLRLVEKDPELADFLAEHLPQWVQIHNQDFMDYEMPRSKHVKVVSNLPYSSSTRILIRLLRNTGLIERMVLMFQKEVARRILARPGTRGFGRLSAMTRAYWRMHSLGVVPPSCFMPKPDVYSEVVVFDAHTTSPPADFDRYERLVAAVFAQPRRTVENSMAIHLHRDKVAIRRVLEDAGIEPGSRPSDMDIEQLLGLVEKIDL